MRQAGEQSVVFGAIEEGKIVQYAIKVFSNLRRSVFSISSCNLVNLSMIIRIRLWTGWSM